MKREMLLEFGEIKEPATVKGLKIQLGPDIAIEKISEQLVMIFHKDPNGKTYQKLINLLSRNLSIDRLTSRINKLKQPSITKTL